MISHDYKCIFVHIPKVAGQSIEHVFLDLHGLSWQQRAPLLLRKNEDAAAGPPRLAHLTAAEYMSCGHVTQATFDSYFKFTFVRNPWSRLVSIYNYLGYFEVLPFKQFLKQDFNSAEDWEPRLLVKPQYDYLFNEKDERLVDYVGRFEDLQSDFNHVCDEIGISKTTLPYVNKTASGNGVYKAIRTFVRNMSPFHRDYHVKGRYTEYYDCESKEIVANAYEREIDIFKYRFGK